MIKSKYRRIFDEGANVKFLDLWVIEVVETHCESRKWYTSIYLKSYMESNSECDLRRIFGFY